MSTAITIIVERPFTPYHHIKYIYAYTISKINTIIANISLHFSIVPLLYYLKTYFLTLINKCFLGNPVSGTVDLSSTNAK